eukprot:gene49095-46835_t
MRRDMRVFAAQDVIVEGGGLAVKKGDRGTVWGPSNTDDKLRVNVKWDERRDAKTSRINVYPAPRRRHPLPDGCPPITPLVPSPRTPHSCVGKRREVS